MATAQRGTVYTLTDPRDGRIRYVGKTVQTLHERLSGHLASPTNPAMRLWISTLRARRMVPIIKAVSTVKVAHLDAEEKRQIRLHAQAGHRLFNYPYYQNHMSDLNGAMTGAVTLQTFARVWGPRIARKLFSPQHKKRRRKSDPGKVALDLLTDSLNVVLGIFVWVFSAHMYECRHCRIEGLKPTSWHAAVAERRRHRHDRHGGFRPINGDSIKRVPMGMRNPDDRYVSTPAVVSVLVILGIAEFFMRIIGS